MNKIMRPFNDEEIYTRREVRKVLKVSQRLFDRLLNKGYIKGYYVGRYRRYHGKDMNEFLSRNEKV